MEKEIYNFEVFCIDPNGQTNMTSEKSLVHGLLFSEKLWKQPLEAESKGRWTIKDDKQALTISIKSVDTSKVLTDFFEAAFNLKVVGTNFDELEDFRLRLLRHLRDIKFKHIRILSDDISKLISCKLYPEINNVGILLRQYLTKFFILRVGLDWWDATAPKVMNDKVRMKKNDRKDEFYTIADADVSLADFDDLGELVYKQSSGFNNPEAVVQKIIGIESLEDLQNFKSELQGNYTKYFKESFRDKDFEPKWKELFRLRNKVAHNGLFFKWELDACINLAKAVTEIISDAESKIDEVVFSIEEKEAIRNATIAAITEDNKPSLSASEKAAIKLQGPTVVGKIELPEEEEYNYDEDDYRSPFRIITPEQLLEELAYAETTLRKNRYNKNKLTYVGYKSFVRNILGIKGFAYGPSFSLIDILRDKGEVELYDVEDHLNNYTAKAIRIKKQKSDFTLHSN